jgi:hypothetical protein
MTSSLIPCEGKEAVLILVYVRRATAAATVAAGAVLAGACATATGNSAPFRLGSAARSGGTWAAEKAAKIDDSAARSGVAVNGGDFRKGSRLLSRFVRPI